MGRDLLSAAEAARRLGVKLETLYAYVSRGLLASLPGGGRDRARRYRRDDVERLRARRDARQGHGPAAAGALRWGEPVLESAITAIDPARGPRFRGRLAVELVREGTPYERVAELLWTGALPAGRPSFDATPVAPALRKARALVPPGTPPLLALAVLVPVLGALDPFRHAAQGDAELPRRGALVRALAAGLALGVEGGRPDAALEAGSVALACAHALGGGRSREVERALDQALVVLADHELNASTFAARVAASTGADLHACVQAALAALSGPRHGGACDRVEALLRETARPERAARVVEERARRGDEIPGFGHRLYQDGDPRAVPLLAAAHQLGSRRGATPVAFALARAMEAAGREPPTIDLALVALASALGLPPGSASGLFAVGRSAGWIAHVAEQREAGFMLRPRARYVGS